MKIVFSWVSDEASGWWNDDLEFAEWRALPNWIKEFINRMDDIPHENKTGTQ